ncbi:MAG: urea transporter [bacterium]|nr:urea transporter [bacterium]
MNHAATVLDALLYSYAQIVFSNRRWVGALLLALTFVKPVIGVTALAGGVISNLVASLLKFEPERIRSGFYGFNGILFGAVFSYYVLPTPEILSLFVVLVIVAFMFSAVLEHHMAAAFNLPGLSLPFMLALYVSLIFLHNYDNIVWRTTFEAAQGTGVAPKLVEQYCVALSQIFVLNSVYAGAILAMAILLFSRVAFVLSVAGFLTSNLCFAWLLPHRGIDVLALLNLNAIFVAIALGGSLILPTLRSFILSMIAIVMLTVFVGVLAQLGAKVSLPVLVLPFNIVVLATLYGLKFRPAAAGLTLLYFKPGSPEENWYHHSTRVARFNRYSAFMADPPFHGKWYVSQGHSGELTHRAEWKYAWDFECKDENGHLHGVHGADLDDYFCYRLPVASPLDGTVVKVVDNVSNNPVGDNNLHANWGNTIVIKHGDQFFSALSHLEPNSAKVKVGQHIVRGEIVGQCGSSGRSPQPHLHFQFQSTDRIGERTLDHPLGYYIEHKNGCAIFHSASVPEVDSEVEGINASHTMQKAFALSLGRRWYWDTDLSGKRGIEQWEVKVDAFNQHYIESSLGAWAYCSIDDRLFYLSSFVGNRNSALYLFYLCALHVPLTEYHNLVWTERLPIHLVYRGLQRYIAEFGVPFGLPIWANGEFALNCAGSDITIQSKHSIKFWTSGLSLVGTGRIVIGRAGEINGFEVVDRNGRKSIATREERKFEE